MSPTFLFVPGAWHGPEAFDQTIEVLKQHGHSGKGLALKSVNGSPPVESIDPDVQLIREAIEAIVSTGGDVVLVMHSYGGMPGSEAMKYFMDRNDGQNGRGKILRMAWICSFVGVEGGTLMQGIGNKDLPWFIVDGDVVNAGNSKEIFYNDMSEAEAEPWIQALRPHAYRTFFSALTVEPWRKIPSAYLVCEQDNAIPLQAQQGMIARVQEIAPNAFDLVETCTASHSPFLSVPDLLAAFLIKAAKV